jgi:hypothetical protein
MDRLSKPHSTYQQRPDTAGAMASTGGGYALATVPAAWPAGISQLAQAVEACQRGEPGQGGVDRPVRAPD